MEIMRYLNIITLRQTTEFIDDSTTIIDTDPRVENWFKPCLEGYTRELVGETYTFVEIPPESEADIKEEEVAVKVQEAKTYLNDTDKYMTKDYDKDTTELEVLRAEARSFIRANEIS